MLGGADDSVLSALTRGGTDEERTAADSGPLESPERREAIRTMGAAMLTTVPGRSGGSQSGGGRIVGGLLGGDRRESQSERPGDGRIDVAIYVDGTTADPDIDDVVDRIPGVEPRLAETAPLDLSADPGEIARQRLDSTADHLKRFLNRIDQVSVRAIDDPVDPPADASLGEVYNWWGDVVEQRDDAAADSNILLWHGGTGGRAARAPCSTTSDGCSTEMDADHAVVGNALGFYADSVTPDLASSAVPTDADLDGRYDHSHDGSGPPPRPALALDTSAVSVTGGDDHPGRGPPVDEESTDETESYVPRRYRPMSSLFGRCQQKLVHEFGHTLGIPHVGRAYKEDGRIHVGPMRGDHYVPSQLPESLRPEWAEGYRDTETLPGDSADDVEWDGSPVVRDLVFSEGVLRHGDDILFDQSRSESGGRSSPTVP